MGNHSSVRIINALGADISGQRPRRVKGECQNRKPFPTPTSERTVQIEQEADSLQKTRGNSAWVNAGRNNIRLDSELRLGKAHTRYLASRKEDFRDFGQIASYHLPPLLSPYAMPMKAGGSRHLSARR